MKHNSIAIPNTIELIALQPSEKSPLISKCQIKVCYVGDEPNRNKSIITKEVATDMAPSLRGACIVGFYNDNEKDFEEHNKTIDISNGKFEIKDTTKPYGFVPTDAKVWFQKFEDDGVEHEYLMTEGYLWTGQYPECARVIKKGNNQSMELDENTLDAYWTKDSNNKYQFFIINEAVISKLCILGEDVEPCFEGSTITKVEFSLDENFKQSVFSLVNKMTEILNEGGTPVYNTFAVEIGDALWSQLFDYLRVNYKDEEDEWCSYYGIEGIYEDNAQKFAILRNRLDGKYYRMNFSLSEENGFVVEGELTEVEKTFVVPEQPQFSPEAVEAYKAQLKKKKEDEEEGSKEDGKSEDEEGSEEGKKPEEEPEDEKKKKKKKEDEEDFACGGKNKKKYNLEEVEEYAELQAKYDELNTQYSAVQEENASLTETVNSLTSEKETLFSENTALKEEAEKLNATITTLSEYKLGIERKEKEDMIYKTFYMLDNELKKEVIENIDSYSLDDIEAKLSVICVRNKIGFENKNEGKPAGTTYNLDNANDNEYVPDWVKAVSDMAKTMKI